MKKKTETPSVTPETRTAETTVPEMTPGEELQVYYNDAYMREKQRLNDIFGIIEEEAPTVVEKVIEPDMSDYVHISELKKQKRRTAVLAVFTAIFAIATVALVVLKFFVK